MNQKQEKAVNKAKKKYKDVEANPDMQWLILSELSNINGKISYLLGGIGVAMALLIVILVAVL